MHNNNVSSSVSFLSTNNTNLWRTKYLQNLPQEHNNNASSRKKIEHQIIIMSQGSASLLFSSSSLFISSSSSSLRRCKSRSSKSSSSSPTKTHHRHRDTNRNNKNNNNARAMSSSSSSSSSSTEPDWKVKQREQDALIGKEETAVKTRVVEMLKPILEGADKVTSQGDDAAQLQLQGELSEKIRQATKMLEEGLVERDSQVRLLLLAAFCSEHLLLLGPPGTAKSEIGRRLSAFTQGQYFERLLTRFSVPEELFGPLSMVGLEKDMYVR